MKVALLAIVLSVMVFLLAGKIYGYIFLGVALPFVIHFLYKVIRFFFMGGDLMLVTRYSTWLYYELRKRYPEFEDTVVRYLAIKINSSPSRDAIPINVLCVLIENNQNNSWEALCNEYTWLCHRIGFKLKYINSSNVNPMPPQHLFRFLEKKIKDNIKIAKKMVMENKINPLYESLVYSPKRIMTLGEVAKTELSEYGIDLKNRELDGEELDYEESREEYTNNHCGDIKVVIKDIDKDDYLQSVAEKAEKILMQVLEIFIYTIGMIPFISWGVSIYWFYNKTAKDESLAHYPKLTTAIHISAFFTLCLVLYVGMEKLFFFIPSDWGGYDEDGCWKSTRSSAAGTIAFALSCFVLDVFSRYERLKETVDYLRKKTK